MRQDCLFTSESVSEGHPDKIADQVSDAILDAILTQDKHAHVACETLVKTGLVLIAGEIAAKASVDFETIIRRVIIEIGYDQDELGFNGHGCGILQLIGKQSMDIAQGICAQNVANQGAGDQGIMFGFATQETASMMPAAIHYAHKLMQRQAWVRKNNIFNKLRPDAKSQVTLRYVDGQPVSIDTVVLSTQHDPDVSQAELQEGIMETIIYPTLPKPWLTKHTKYLINPSGRFVIGGPVGDCGLTGRKIIVDTYGGAAHHGGGAFSGKDPSKVDRSGAYMARYIAKNIVGAQLARKCQVQLSYAIGVAHPTSIMVDTFGTGKMNEWEIETLIRSHFDLTPHGMITHLNLLQPIYQKTVNYGHFGREEPQFTWEKMDQIEALL